MAQRVKHLPAMPETWVRSLGQEDPLEKEMATHSSILAWRIPWMEEPGRLQSKGRKESTWLSDFTHSLTENAQNCQRICCSSQHPTTSPWPPFLRAHVLTKAYNLQFSLCPFERYMYLLQFKNVLLKFLKAIPLKRNHPSLHGVGVGGVERGQDRILASTIASWLIQLA